MKKLATNCWQISIILLIMITVGEYGHAQNKKAVQADSVNYISISDELLRKKILKYIHALEDWASKNKIEAKVFTLKQETYYGLKTYRVSALLTVDALESYPPTNYTFVNNYPVLVYSGLEDISKKDLRFLSHLKKVLGTKLFNAPSSKEEGIASSDSVYLVGLNGERRKVAKRQLGPSVNFNHPETYIHPPIFELIINEGKYIIEQEISNRIVIPYNNIDFTK